MAAEKLSLRKALFGSPLVVALAAAAIVVFGLTLVGYVRRGGFWSPSVDARVVDGRARSGRAEITSGERRLFPLQGEVYGEAERLRESAALTLSTTLCAGTAALQQRPVGSVQELLSRVSSEGGLPPGMAVASDGTKVSSNLGEYFVRYRSSPLGVEVVSLGKGNFVGRAFLIRIPDDALGENALSYYAATSGEKVQVPAPFAAAAEIVKSGWLPERFRASQLPGDELVKSKQWLDQLKAQGVTQ